MCQLHRNVYGNCDHSGLEKGEGELRIQKRSFSGLKPAVDVKITQTLACDVQGGSNMTGTICV
jgi:hypothetical protein